MARTHTRAKKVAKNEGIAEAEKKCPRKRDAAAIGKFMKTDAQTHPWSYT